MKQIVTATWAWWGFLVGLCLLAHGSRAQGLATLRGTVADSLSGQPLVGVSVGLQGQPGGTATDALGNFRLAGLAPGTYLVRVGALGYRSVAQAVTVGASETRTVPFAIAASALNLSEVTVSQPRDPTKAWPRLVKSIRCCGP